MKEKNGTEPGMMHSLWMPHGNRILSVSVRLSLSEMNLFKRFLSRSITLAPGGSGNGFQAGFHDDVTKWKQFPRYWSFVMGIHRSPVNSPHNGQWRGALMFSLICAWTDGWVNNRYAGDLKHHCGHYNVTIMRFLKMIYCALLTFLTIGSL